MTKWAQFGRCYFEREQVPDGTITFCTTATSLLYSRDVQWVESALASLISILVDMTSYLHFEGTICSSKDMKVST